MVELLKRSGARADESQITNLLLLGAGKFDWKER
jgi:hypothetical protein